MRKLYDLVDQYDAASPEDAPPIEAEIWRTYGLDRAILVLDMSGFSRMTRRFGIVHYLAMVRRMQTTTRPLVEAFQGEIVKYEADNLFAVFAEPGQAVRCAVAIVERFESGNAWTPDERDIHVSIGLSWGRILHVPDQDFFGNAVNIASKLGEDLADSREVLVDDDLYQQLPGGMAGLSFEPMEFSVSGLALKAWKVKSLVPHSA
jgi:adenylate cyclase